MSIRFDLGGHSYKVPPGTRKVLRENITKAGLSTELRWKVRPITGVKASDSTPSFRVKGVTPGTNLVSLVIKPGGNDSAMEFHIVPPNGLTAQAIVEMFQSVECSAQQRNNGNVITKTLNEKGGNKNKQVTGEEALQVMGISASAQKNSKVTLAKLKLSASKENAEFCILAFWEAHKGGWFTWKQARIIVEDLFPGSSAKSYGKAIVSLVEKYQFCECEGGGKKDSWNRPRIRLTVKGRKIVEGDTKTKPELNQENIPVKPTCVVGHNGQSSMSVVLQELNGQLLQCDEQLEMLKLRREKITQAISSLKEVS